MVYHWHFLIPGSFNLPLHWKITYFGLFVNAQRNFCNERSQGSSDDSSSLLSQKANEQENDRIRTGGSGGTQEQPVSQNGAGGGSLLL